jgi:acyl-CoA reductase-like NAD-dependent aldehyde dehydrogenase
MQEPLAGARRSVFVPDCRLWREEIFGPVALVSTFESIDQALELANDSPFGLQGHVFTRDLAAVCGSQMTSTSVRYGSMRRPDSGWTITPLAV